MEIQTWRLLLEAEETETIITMAQSIRPTSLERTNSRNAKGFTSLTKLDLCIHPLLSYFYSFISIIWRAFETERHNSTWKCGMLRTVGCLLQFDAWVSLIWHSGLWTLHELDNPRYFHRQLLECTCFQKRIPRASEYQFLFSLINGPHVLTPVYFYLMDRDWSISIILPSDSFPR